MHTCGSDVDTLHAELRERGANIVGPPEVRVYVCQGPFRNFVKSNKTSVLK